MSLRTFSTHSLPTVPLTTATHNDGNKKNNFFKIYHYRPETKPEARETPPLSHNLPPPPRKKTTTIVNGKLRYCPAANKNLLCGVCGGSSPRSKFAQNLTLTIGIWTIFSTGGLSHLCRKKYFNSAPKTANLT